MGATRSIRRGSQSSLSETASSHSEFDFPVHPHMLRHACGYQLANRGVDTRSVQAYLGQKNIQHTKTVVVSFSILVPCFLGSLREKNGSAGTTSPAAPNLLKGAKASSRPCSVLAGITKCGAELEINKH